MNKEIDSRIAITILVVITIFLIGWMMHEYQSIFYPMPSQGPIKLAIKRFLEPSARVNFKKFISEGEFKNYLTEANKISLGTGYPGQLRALPAVPMIVREEEMGAGVTEKQPERFSGTNVQVASIDEPDIVKTNGQEIYFSSQSPIRYFIEGRSSEKIMPPETGGIKIIKAFPLEELSLKKEIERIGDLLLYKNILMVFSNEKIYAYDVSLLENPSEIWAIDLDQSSQIVGVRFFKEKLYLVIRKNIRQDHPCPIKLMTIKEIPLTINCEDIYHPDIYVPTEVTYTALAVNPLTGEAEKEVSFIGSADSSLIYMSKNNLYATYSYTQSINKFFLNFLQEKGQDLIPVSIIDKLKKLDSYDISESAKMTELQVIFENYFSSLDEDERLKIENELNNRLTDYHKDHQRDLEKTALVKIDLENFNVGATGIIPGQPLNQFSLDEYENYLRIATTVGERTWWGPWLGWQAAGGANDIYILDKDLKIVGSIQNLGLGEKIYSARFLEDKGYLVTFRQIDPFYVLDLSNPAKPELKGELKIPGYSSYLHPITKDEILGIGKEESQVKISLFEVIDPSRPKEKAKYTLNEYWSDILDTHHAFLLDSKHEIFFLPGATGGYVFSYKENKLQLIKAVSDINAKRALYINDYLYIIGDDKLIVLNEINWEKVKEIKF